MTIDELKKFITEHFVYIKSFDYKEYIKLDYVNDMIDLKMSFFVVNHRQEIRYLVLWKNYEHKVYNFNDHHDFKALRESIDDENEIEKYNLFKVMIRI